MALATSAPIVSGPAARAQSPVGDIASADAAAQRAMREVFGADASIVISAPVLSLVPGAGPVVSAAPESSGRTGGPLRFVLYADLDQTQRVGRLTARVEVRVPHVRARQKVAARTAVTPADVEVVSGDIGRQPVAPLPTLAMVTTATTRKALLAGEVITQASLVTPPLVASGQEVVTVARVAGLEVRGRAIAAQSGGLGQTVIVVNPDSRRKLRGRVVGAAAVEVHLGS